MNGNFPIFASPSGKFLSSSAVVFQIDEGDIEKQVPDSEARLDWLGPQKGSLGERYSSVAQLVRASDC